MGLPLLVNQSAALLVLVAGLQSAWWVTQWRARVINPVVLTPTTDDEAIAPEGWYERLLDRLSQRGLHVLGQIGAATLWLGGWALLVALSAKAEPEPARIVLKISSPELVIGRLREAEICSVRAPWSPWYWTPAARLPLKGMALLR